MIGGGAGVGIISVHFARPVHVSQNAYAFKLKSAVGNRTGWTILCSRESDGMDHPLQ